MKKLFSAVLVLLLLSSLAACHGEGKAPSEPNSGWMEDSQPADESLSTSEALGKDETGSTDEMASTSETTSTDKTTSTGKTTSSGKTTSTGKVTNSGKTTDAEKTEQTTKQKSTSRPAKTTVKTTKTTKAAKVTKKTTTVITKTKHTHAFGKASCTAPAKCACGVTQGAALGHTFFGGKCSRCGTASALGNTVLEGTDWGFGQVALVGDKVYYTYIYEVDKLFLYDGETTRTISIIGRPNLMIADDTHIYYHNYETSDLYRVDLKTETCEKFFSAPGLIYEFFKYNGTVYVSADDEKEHEILYAVNAGTQKAEKLLDTGNARMRFAIAEDYFTCFFNDLSIYTIDYKTQEVTKKPKEDTEVTTKEYWLPDTKNFTRFDNVVKNTKKDDIIYRARKYLVNGSYYVPVQWHTPAYTGDRSYWVFNTDFFNIVRVDAESGKQQKLTQMTSPPYWCGGFGVNEQQLVCIIRNAKDGNFYTYRMDLDGGNIRCIGARVNKKMLSGTEAEGAAATLTAMLATNTKEEGEGGKGACDTCGGDGRETCTYCGGTGRGTPIYMLGEKVEQGCTYCGSSGWRVCSHCHGYGEN